ncbi:glycoside hydrolase family 5 protein [Adhaeribacter aquaticus]|uniref:glycoside hydrolase family 5 protein n=1 Tax=Adhaeribacter aquaticus TaxID=299567 RepID=UPI000417DF10|nr:glycoside hydrolase family 5 protein [Adhaeribacter aquaticus]
MNYLSSMASYFRWPVLFLCLSLACKPDKKEDAPAPKNASGGTPTPTTPVTPNPNPSIANAVEAYGALKVNGNKIVGKDNTPVQLRGMSFFWSQWIGKYYTAETVEWLKKDWRCTLVRASMAVDDGEGYLRKPEVEKQKVITVVDAAIANGLYVIIDWHSHHAEDYREEAKTFFAEMAKKYGDKPNVIYEIYNEPLNVSWSGVIKPYAEAVIAAIRQHDPDNIVVVGTRNWSQEVAEAANNPIAGVNIAYTLHYYAATHKQGLRDKATQALNRGVALMVTEYGTAEASGDGNLDVTETKTWWKFLDDNKISWANWSLADKVEATAALRPNASPTGGWTDAQITPSGLLVREELRAKNPKP